LKPVLPSLAVPHALGKTLLAASIAAAFAIGTSAHAQQSPVAKADAVKDGKEAKDSTMQQVEVRGAVDAYDPRRDDTAAKIVVNHDEIVKYGDTSVLDVLKRVPGVTVSGNGGRGGEVRMRGLGNGYTQILINGERAPASFTIDSLAPDMIERIEVLRAASAEFSTQSIAGTINIVLKKTVKAGQRELKVGYSHAHDFKGPNANLQLADKAGALAWSVTANVRREHFSRTVHNVEEHVDPAGTEDGLRLGSLPESGQITLLNFSPRLIWKLENGDTLTSQTMVNASHFGNDVHTLVDTQLGLPPAYPDLDQTMNNDNNLLREEVNWVHGFASGAKLDAKLSTTTGSASNATYRTGAGRTGVAALHELIKSNNSVRGMNSTGKFTSANWEGHALAFGWDAATSHQMTRAATATTTSRTCHCRAATSCTRPTSRAWQCTARTSGTSRRAGRCTWARAGKAFRPGWRAIPSPPCTTARPSGARCSRPCTSCPTPRATSCASPSPAPIARRQCRP
jgi:outer membrane receptor for ferrienterochelin and colicins